MKAIICEPIKRARIAEIKSDLKSLQSLVDGYIQVVYPFEDRIGIVCNDEGKLNGLEPNRGLKDENGELYDILVGTFVIVGLSNENFKSLNEAQTTKFMEMFYYPETFVKMGDKIISIKLETE